MGPWLLLLGFGIYHGINPGMGWLFALALGLQQQSGRAVLAALPPIALGHAISLVMTAVLLGIVGAFLPLDTLRLLTAGILLVFGIYKLLTYYRHPRWVGMQVSGRDLIGWSFLMSTAHGAGLILAPVLIGISEASELTSHGSHSEHIASLALNTSGISSAWGLAIGFHTIVMLLTMTAIAWIVYRKVGLSILRSSWINFDLIWAGALLFVGGIALWSAL
ncbi:MAG: hypothetical protein EXR62_06850 [Chloroflexi bacterium]|nr:hypothetical protein [Chloroflexota bacterium]